MLADFHLHSDFSGDCHVPMKHMIEEAIHKGIQRLCFTDHHDMDYPTGVLPIDFTLNIDAYVQQIEIYQHLYRDKIELLMGIELGVQPHLHPQLSQIVAAYPFDFVLASSHLAKGLDPYAPDFFQHYTQYDGYLAYFEDTLQNIQNYNDYDIYGHLDYIIRYGNFSHKHICYADFQDILDLILKGIIDQGKGIELNTSGFRHNLMAPHPSIEILTRYYELGGEIITLGSDSHTPQTLMFQFDLGKEILKKIGFSHFTTFVQRKPYFHLI